MKACGVSGRNGDTGVTFAVSEETRGKALAYAVNRDSFCGAFGYTEWRMAMEKAAVFICRAEWGCMDGKDCPAYEWCELGGLNED